ncbi:bifunctional diguanylate cyclase/phosphodiesterase [Rubellimicrobium sp. CFH 75288]|uniref:putative bifunctional diguanylate cyclase/phosphodiesterase n=1 Tax=Rubellimicrobium sp. CFH 75288 TaxID=2697034 RepID=UPI001412DEE1|nr:bifunctional diguanylate cyclase/phosphodiesterase [Rubellimicrobium sp. CFH 75288]NAZ35874.1 EAL domain-containing protein [Rubellimicrobium sp. CFH 75288]
MPNPRDCARRLWLRLRAQPALLSLPVLAAPVLFATGGAVPAAVGSLTIAAALLGMAAAAARTPCPDRDAATGLPRRGAVVAALDRWLPDAARGGGATAALVVEIDRFKLLEERHDHPVLDRLLSVTAARLGGVLRGSDVVARLDGPCFAAALSPARRMDLESAIQLAGRLQRTLSEPVAVGGFAVHPTVSIGFALPARLQAPTGETLLQAAALAAIEAGRHGPSAIRSYSEAMRRRAITQGSLGEEVAAALDRGEVRAFFQPQISTRTGAITGFEALARWVHPARGLLPPGEFLPAVEEAGLMPRLGEVMLSEALSALRRWDGLGLAVPRIGVNFSSAELCDPRLLDRIGWEIERFDLTPDRLVVEVLETVVAARPDDMVIRNLAGLARLGCCLDLDDFGTGHASISSIRRFSIERIKIDRSFVARIDEDAEQARMVGAILTMAERLGLDTLAEGVETAGERTMLARLGCGHVQGFGIARPMPLEETEAWIRGWDAEREGGPSHLRVV